MMPKNSVSIHNDNARQMHIYTRDFQREKLTFLGRDSNHNTQVEYVLYLNDISFIITIIFLQGVNLDKLLGASRYISDFLGRTPSSKVLQAKTHSKL